MRRLRLHFWLYAMDVLHVVFGQRGPYLWALRKASDATDWEETQT